MVPAYGALTGVDNSGDSTSKAVIVRIDPKWSRVLIDVNMQVDEARGTQQSLSLDDLLRSGRGLKLGTRCVRVRTSKSE